jgi:hypothetical protein
MDGIFGASGFNHGRVDPMTQKKHATPIWPFMITLVFLFTMSVTAPRGWERFAQRTELAKPNGTYAKDGKPSRAPLTVGAHNTFVAREPSLPQPATGMRAETRPRITSEYVPSATPALPKLNSGTPVAPTKTDVTTKTDTAVKPVEPVVPFRLNGSPRVEAISSSVPTPAAIGLASAVGMPKVNEASKVGPQLNAAPIQQPVQQPPLAPPAPAVATQPTATQPIAGPTLVATRVEMGPTVVITALPKMIEPTLAPPQPVSPFAATPVLPTPVVRTPVVAAPKVVAPVAPVVAKPDPAPAGFSLHGGHRPQPTANNTTPPNNTAAPNITTKPELFAARPQAGLIKKPIVTEDPQPTPGVVDPRHAPLPKPREAIVVAPTPVAEKSWWPKSIDLDARLARLKQRRETMSWAQRASELLTDLGRHDDASPNGIQETVAKLRAAVADTHLVDERELDPQTAVEVRLTRHALIRRLDVWESLGNLMKKARIPAEVAEADTKQLELCLVELDRQTAAAGETGAQWRNYLMLESLGEVAEGKVVDRNRRRTLAKTVLDRIHKAGASSEQNAAFLNEGPFAQLNAELRGLAAEEVDGRKLLESIESFEAGGLPADAHALAAQCKLLDESTDADRRQLATWLTSHYRNANVRVTLSADLLNRMMPSELKKNAPVNEYVLGLPTHGWSTTRTGIGIRFLPSQDRLAMRMEAEGVVHAQTQTQSGPVRVFNQSDSNFIAHKDLALTADGVVVNRAVASTHSRNKLRGIKTDFDHMPILGTIVESIALDQHAEKKPLAQAESQARVSRGVERGLDQEIDKHLKTADAALQERIVGPLAGLDLAPEVIEMQSNEARAIMRVRIAGDDQLAAYTPRPRAYSDNVGSVQVHQSAVNNVLEKSQLHGRRFTLPELYRFVVEKYYLPDDVDTAELPGDIELTFAKTDPLTVRCEAGSIELRLALEELSRAGKSWRDFVVRVKFKTEVVDGRTCFVRDGSVKISGPKLSITSQIPVRTVFAKVFPDDMRVVLWPDKFRNDPRFADLDIEQVDIRDGWIGMAIGPRRLQASALLPPKR